MSKNKTRPPLGRRCVFALACLLAIPPVLLFITTPMDAGHQALLGAAGVLLMALVQIATLVKKLQLLIISME